MNQMFYKILISYGLQTEKVFADNRFVKMMEAFSFITSYPYTLKVSGVISSEVYNF